MSIPTRSQVNWAKSTAMRIIDEMRQPIDPTGQHSCLALELNQGLDCMEKRYKLHVGDAEGLCNILFHLHTLFGPLNVVVKAHESNGVVWIGCYSEPHYKREAIIRMKPKKPEESSPTESEDTAADQLPTEVLLNEIKGAGEGNEKESGPTTPSSAHQTSSERLKSGVLVTTLPTIEHKTDDLELLEEDYQSVDLKENTAVDNEEWVNVDYPAGSNGWWRARQRAKGH